MYSDDEPHEYEQRVFNLRLTSIDFDRNDPDIIKCIKELHSDKEFSLLSATKKVRDWEEEKQKQLKCALMEMAEADGKIVPEEQQILDLFLKTF